MDQRKRVTIKDVARRACVSPTTVSHALGGQRPVSEATRSRVLRAVEELGYRPHPGARSLKASETGVIALCVASATPGTSYAGLEYFFRVVHGVAEATQKHGYALVVVPESNGGDSWDRLLFDGAIISDPASGDPNIRFLRRHGLPYVTISRDPDRPDEGYWVGQDVDETTRLALDHLRARGARDIAAVSWLTTDYWTQTALTTYRQWCAEHGATARVEQVPEKSDAALEAAARGLLEGPQRPDAVYAVYELPAVAMLRQAAAQGIRVPDELMVIGPSDFGLAEKSSPPMTTLEYDPERHGFEAAEMLIRLVRGQAVAEPHRVLEVKLVERASTRR